jgi:hypothetical protein
MSSDIIYSDATKLAELIRTKAVSPVEVVQAHVDRIEAVDPKINTIVTVAGDALEAAKSAEAVRRSSRGASPSEHLTPGGQEVTSEKAPHPGRLKHWKPKEKTMPIAIRFTQTGGLNVLKLETFAEAAPGLGEVWIEQQAIGVNYLDVMQRNGSAPIQLPSGLGLEAAGRVSAIVPGVTNVAVGERVAYILGAIGSYASGRLYPAERLVGLPDGLSANDAAAILFKGITAHYLLHSTYAVGPGTVVLLYGAVGALGQINGPLGQVAGRLRHRRGLEGGERRACESRRL